MAAIGRDIDVVVIEFSGASKGACDSRRDVHSRGLWLIDGNVVGNVFIATQIQVNGINDDVVIDRGDAADAVGSILRLQFRAECVGYAIEPDPTMIGRDGQIGKGDSRIPGQLI